MDTQPDAGIHARRSPYLERHVQLGTASGRVLSVSFPETPEEDADADVRAILSQWPPRAWDRREQRRDAGIAALEYLQEVVEARAGDFKEEVEPAAPVDGQSPDTWWKRTARPAVQEAADAGAVDYNNGTKVYTWTGTDAEDTRAAGGVYDPTEEFDQ